MALEAWVGCSMLVRNCTSEQDTWLAFEERGLCEILEGGYAADPGWTFANVGEVPFAASRFPQDAAPVIPCWFMPSMFLTASACIP